MSVKRFVKEVLGIPLTKDEQLEVKQLEFKDKAYEKKMKEDLGKYEGNDKLLEQNIQDMRSTGKVIAFYKNISYISPNLGNLFRKLILRDFNLVGEGRKGVPKVAYTPIEQGEIEVNRLFSLYRRLDARYTQIHPEYKYTDIFKYNPSFHDAFNWFSSIYSVFTTVEVRNVDFVKYFLTKFIESIYKQGLDSKLETVDAMVMDEQTCEFIFVDILDEHFVDILDAQTEKYCFDDEELEKCYEPMYTIISTLSQIGDIQKQALEETREYFKQVKESKKDLVAERIKTFKQFEDSHPTTVFLPNGAQLGLDVVDFDKLKDFNWDNYRANNKFTTDTESSMDDTIQRYRSMKKLEKNMKDISERFANLTTEYNSSPNEDKRSKSIKPSRRNPRLILLNYISGWMKATYYSKKDYNKENLLDLADDLVASMDKGEISYSQAVRVFREYYDTYITKVMKPLSYNEMPKGTWEIPLKSTKTTTTTTTIPTVKHNDDDFW